MLATRILKFLSGLEIKVPLDPDIQVLNPYADGVAFGLCQQFYKKYYQDNDNRYLILGINPGRHGAGLTGIPFTDPIKLDQYCGISNSFPKKAELSADFIYAMIAAFGGPEKFYKRFYFSSVSPLGFVQGGKNLNYYDSKALQECLQDFIEGSLKMTLALGMDTSVCYCLGEGDNYKYLSRLNNSRKFFGKIIPLAHPRFIMQYRRKHLETYVADYLAKFDRVA